MNHETDVSEEGISCDHEKEEGLAPRSQLSLSRVVERMGGGGKEQGETSFGQDLQSLSTKPGQVSTHSVLHGRDKASCTDLNLTKSFQISLAT